MKRSLAALIGLIAIAVSVASLVAAPAINAVSVVPTAIRANIPTLITVRALITDTFLIPTSVNLLRVDVSGRTISNLGTMYDDGTNGDAVGGDRTFSRVVSMNEPVTGTARFRVSAAFRGVLRRTLSDVVTLEVQPVPDTSAWTAVSDGDGLFELKVPPEWRLQLVESPLASGAVVKTIEFLLPDGNWLFIVDVFTRPGWDEQLLSDFSQPIVIAETDDYIFAYWLPQSELGDGRDVQMIPFIPDIIGTFRLTR